MARISGVDLNDNWRLDFALTNIKGVGWALSKRIVTELKLEPSKKVSQLSPDEVSKLAKAVEAYPIEGELVRQTRTNVKRLQTIGSYIGLRHSRGLPVRGQRTKSNARTKRGKRKTVGSFKKEALTKMTTSDK